MMQLKDCPSWGEVCYRQGKHRWTCSVCEQETPRCFKRCKFYDPRNKRVHREVNVCEDCGKTYHNFMSFLKHQIWCESRFVHMLGKLIVNADGLPRLLLTGLH